MPIHGTWEGKKHYFLIFTFRKAEGGLRNGKWTHYKVLEVHKHGNNEKLKYIMCLNFHYWKHYLFEMDSKIEIRKVLNSILQIKFIFPIMEWTDIQYKKIIKYREGYRRREKPLFVSISLNNYIWGYCFPIFFPFLYIFQCCYNILVSWKKSE